MVFLWALVLEQRSEFEGKNIARWVPHATPRGVKTIADTAARTSDQNSPGKGPEALSSKDTGVSAAKRRKIGGCRQ